jgi:hypothetical protein
MFCGAAGSTGVEACSGAMRPPALSRVNRTFGVLGCPWQALTGRQDRVKLAMRWLVKAQPARKTREVGPKSKKREPQANQFYLILTVILFETSGGLNG